MNSNHPDETLTLSDSHCHLDISGNWESATNFANHLSENPNNNVMNYALMATNHLDIEVIQQLVKDQQVNENNPNLIGFFGIHPWYSHLFCHEKISKQDHYEKVLYPAPSPELLDNLPPPIYIETHCDKITKYINTIRKKFDEQGQKRKNILGIGEIGLDKPFRIPRNGFYGNKQGLTKDDNKKLLTNCRVTMQHQVSILRRMLQLAQEVQLPISLHCVKAHGVLFDTVKQFDLPTVILHSFSGSSEQVKIWKSQYNSKPGVLFFSFSHWINGETSEKLTSILKNLHDNNILIESDLPVDELTVEEHNNNIRGIFDRICQEKNWNIQQGEAILQDNWEQAMENI